MTKPYFDNGTVQLWLADRLDMAALVTDEPGNTIIVAALEAWLLQLEKTASYKQRRAELIIATTPVTTTPSRKAKP